MIDEETVLAELTTLLVGVFNLESPNRIDPSKSLIADLGADSLDFVEILHLVERKFGVALNVDEIMLGGAELKVEDLFEDGRLTEASASLLQKTLPSKGGQIKSGMGRLELFSLFTVLDLARLITDKAAGKADS